MSKWSLVLPPSRPDTLDLERIVQHTKGLDRNAPVAVLGSTPEFRDLLVELGFLNVYVFERNRGFLMSLQEQRIFVNDETLVEGDWLESLARFKGRFAVVLSDLTSGNIGYEDRARFYGMIEDSLAPGGLFIDKNLTNSRALLTIEAINEKYRFAPPNLQMANYFSCEAVFCSELLSERGIVDTTYIYARLKEMLPGARFSRLIAAAQTITPPGCMWYYGRKWEDLSGDYCSDLALVNRYELNPAQPYFLRAQQFVWQKRLRRSAK